MADNGWLLAQQAVISQVLVETMGMFIHDLDVLATKREDTVYTEEAYRNQSNMLGSIYNDIMQNR